MTDSARTDRARFHVIDTRSGRVRSRHATEALAFVAIDRAVRRLDRIVNASRYQHGGLGPMVDLAVFDSATLGASEAIA